MKSLIQKEHKKKILHIKYILIKMNCYFVRLTRFYLTE